MRGGWRLAFHSSTMTIALHSLVRGAAHESTARPIKSLDFPRHSTSVPSQVCVRCGSFHLGHCEALDLVWMVDAGPL